MAHMAHASPSLREWLREAPFTLTMSSGFFGFFAHTGVLEVLEEQGLMPSRLSGSSAGALVTGAWASGIGAASLAKELLSLEREDFWDPGFGLGLLRGAMFRKRLESLLPNATFEACRVPLSISVYDVFARKTRVLDRGQLATAIQASCAVPVLFHPVWIDGRPYSDGGIRDRPGIEGVPRSERVLYHHLVSRSPWRRKADPQLVPPSREGLVTLGFESLPRVGPYKLHIGREAYDEAKRRMSKALDEPVART